jgi:hypothetical protein
MRSEPDVDGERDRLMEARDVVNPIGDITQRRVVAKVDRKGRIRKDNSQARIARRHIMMQTHGRSPSFQRLNQRALSESAFIAGPAARCLFRSPTDCVRMFSDKELRVGCMDGLRFDSTAR